VGAPPGPLALGKGGDSVAKMLNDRSVPPPRGTAWNAAAIRRIVHHRAYMGEMTRRMHAEVFTFAVPVIVPPDLWALANATSDGNRKTATRNAKHAYLLSSTKDEPLLCCTRCHAQGKEYIMGGRARPRPEHTKPWLHYRCNNRYGATDHSVSAQQLETAIWNALVQTLTNPRVALEHIAQLSDAASAQYHEHERELAGLHTRAAEVRAAQERLAEAAAWGKLPADILAA
jgi:hypothetical protein